MSLSWTDLLEEIHDLFIKITRGKIFKKECEDFESHVKSCLKLNKKKDWKYILASEDILEDSNAAIENFLKFGLSGPTKLDFVGEKYLRLYGLLNATYLQQQALTNLSKFYQCPDLLTIKNQIDKLKIREIRNQLGAHSVNYDDKADGIIKAFVPVRLTIEDFKIDYFEHTNDSYCEIDLRSAVEEHLKTTCAIYLNIMDKAIKTIYRSNPEKIKTLSEQWKPFERMLHGDILVKCHNNTGENDFMIIKTIIR